MLINKKTSNGFTIVELTVAMLVSAVILAAGYDLFKALRDTARRQEQAITLSRKMAEALEQIRGDLLHAIPYDGNGAVFIGANPAIDSGKSTLLEFNSLCTGSRGDKIRGVRQIHRIRYELTRENDSICLYRRAVPAVGKNNSKNDDNKKLIFNGIEQIKILFYNGKKLLSSFSSKLNLPVYVKLELTAKGRSWPLTVKLPCGTAETEGL
ncbi:MAG: prepilin-type N-terminal cleavage/methylation domain-containing protein [Planctomycetes bacterium]|nr:prepilin-type N-terminal cleavage/methylation domain-containing protein [Planctomycetota bacterium]